MAALFDLNDLEKRMRTGLDALKRELIGLRTGRASANLLDPVFVQLYGQRMPLSQVGTVSVPEPGSASSATNTPKPPASPSATSAATAWRR